MSAAVYLGDCIESMQTWIADESIDSIVTDPPYELGFMGKKWDSSGIANSVAMWTEALRVLKPGGHLLAFSGSRTYHRMVCAIEDAGFEIRDQIMWIYGSGFPKSHNLDGDWDGWGTALKPAHEPVVVARKPFKVTVAANVASFGTGAYNIDACRVPTDDNLNGGAYSGQRQDSDSPWAASGSLHQSTGEAFVQPEGRWPANIIHDGSDEVVEAFPQAAGQLATASSSSSSRKNQNVYGAMERGSGGAVARIESDKSAARFFYCAKASKAERNLNVPGGNKHPTVKPVAVCAYLQRLVTPPGGTTLDIFMGSGSFGVAAKAEGFNYIGLDNDPESVATAELRIAA